MLKLCKRNDESVLAKVNAGQIDAVKMSESNLVDDIIFSMYESGILNTAFGSFTDKRRNNSSVPIELIMSLAVAAKMKVRTSLTDIPYALTDHRVISALGYNMVSDNGFMDEGSLRNLIGKYTADELFSEYNELVQNRIVPFINAEPTVHMIDCTKIKVNLDNQNYEGAGLVNHEGELIRGYKLATIRSVIGDTGIIQDIRFGSIEEHDLTLSHDMILNSPVLKPGDVLINDRGFMSRDIMNDLKTHRGVDTYIPLKKNMETFVAAVNWAIETGEWNIHPMPERRAWQKISSTIELGELWRSDQPELDVPLNGCVVYDEPYGNYHVFVTTNMNASANEIVMTYSQRWEIEEDYRQLKDFWKLEDFKSTKLSTIAFHIISVLIGYLFFQLYTETIDSELSNKSLPVLLKNYVSKAQPYCIIYSGEEFGIMSLLDIMKLYANCPKIVQDRFDEILG